MSSHRTLYGIEQTETLRCNGVDCCKRTYLDELRFGIPEDPYKTLVYEGKEVIVQAIEQGTFYTFSYDPKHDSVYSRHGFGNWVLSKVESITVSRNSTPINIDDYSMYELMERLPKKEFANFIMSLATEERE